MTSGGKVALVALGIYFLPRLLNRNQGQLLGYDAMGRPVYSGGGSQYPRTGGGVSLGGLGSGLANMLRPQQQQQQPRMSGNASGSFGGGGNGAAQQKQDNSWPLLDKLNSYFDDKAESRQLAELMRQGYSPYDAARIVGENPRDVVSAITGVNVAGDVGLVDVPNTYSSVDSLPYDPTWLDSWVRDELNTPIPLVSPNEGAYDNQFFVEDPQPSAQWQPEEVQLFDMSELYNDMVVEPNIVEG